ncbi:hypothetical protein [Streptomyces galilaeus]|nr:hypothetical protein [Streptomyces galilaeus]
MKTADTKPPQRCRQPPNSEGTEGGVKLVQCTDKNKHHQHFRLG